MNDKNKLVVVKNNAIIEAGFRLSIYESRILLICISQINSVEEINVNNVFTVHAADFTDLLKVKGKSSYEYLEKATDKLLNRLITIHLSSTDILKTHWVSSARYRKDLSIVELQFAQQIIPYISHLRREFTQYKLNNVLRFQSNYSIRFYELFIQWKKGERTIEVDWIKQHFQLEDKYNRVTDLKKRVIDIAIKEINVHSDLNVEYEQIKRGRNVVAFKFTYALKNAVKTKSLKKPSARTNVYKGGITGDEIKSFVSANPDLTEGKQIDEISDMIVRDRKAEPLVSVADLVVKAAQHNEMAKMRDILGQ